MKKTKCKILALLFFLSGCNSNSTIKGFISSNNSPDIVVANNLFKSRGNFFTEIYAPYELRGSAIQADGKIVLVGGMQKVSEKNFFVTRLNANGTLDTSFGTGGMQNYDATGTGTDDNAVSVAIQSDGKIVIFGDINSIAGLSDYGILRINSDGSIDTSFGTNGVVRIDISGAGSYEQPNALALQSDGKIILTGASTTAGNANFTTVRLNTNGSLDAGFGAGGIVMTDVNGGGFSDYARDVLIQSDGKIVVTGSIEATAGNWDIGLVRYNVNGTLDAGFGAGGIVLTDISGTVLQDDGFSLDIQVDGKIVVGGSTYALGNSDIAVLRYTTNGTLDNTFGTGGITVVDVSGTSTTDMIYSMLLQSDGKILANGFSVIGGKNYFSATRINTNGTLDAGFATGGISIVDASRLALDNYSLTSVINSTGELFFSGNFQQGAQSHAVVAKLSSSGSVDTSFASSGYKDLIDYESYDSYDDPFGHIVFPDQKIMTAGIENSIVALKKFNSDGSVDSSFGLGGKAVVDLDSIGISFPVINTFAVQSDGKILLAGYYLANFLLIRLNADATVDSSFGTNGAAIKDINGIDRASVIGFQSDGKIIVAGDAGFDFTVARFNANGSIDNSFGTAGASSIDISGSGSVDIPRAMKVQSDDKIVVSGITMGGGADPDMTAVRFNGDGSIDNSFGTLGIAEINIDGASGPHEYVSSLAIQPDGKIVLTGESQGATNDMAIARLNTDGSVDTTFGGTGLVITDIAGFADWGRTVSLLPNGKIVVTGETMDIMAATSYALVRYNYDGSLDTSFGVNGFSIGKFGLPSDEEFYVKQVSVQSNGQIVMSGAVYNSTSSFQDYYLARLSSNGF